ncbi:MAG: serine/threonine-protein kinase, partial [Myxococcota bacterium]
MYVGATLGSYVITGTLSRGGMGVVYIAKHKLIGRKAAIKVLLPEVSRKPLSVKRFFNEARVTAAIGHPGIVEILDFGYSEDKQAYLVMEFLDGETLRDRLKRCGRMAAHETVAIADHLASALSAAHAQGAVHRDLKPTNIMLVSDPGVRFGERPKILDFGIAKLSDKADDNSYRTRTGMVMGTPSYMSPEQARGAGAVDHRADLYALGCILYTMLCGRPPFIGEGAGEIIGMQQFVEPTPPRAIERSIPSDIDNLIMRLLAKHPDDRPGSADEVRAVLAESFTTDFAATGARSPDAVPTVRTSTFRPEPTPRPEPSHRPGLDELTAPTTGPRRMASSSVQPSAIQGGDHASLSPSRPYPVARDHGGVTTLSQAASQRFLPSVRPWRWVLLGVFGIAVGIGAVALVAGSQTRGPAAESTSTTAVSGAAPGDVPEPGTARPNRVADERSAVRGAREPANQAESELDNETEPETAIGPGDETEAEPKIATGPGDE